MFGNFLKPKEGLSGRVPPGQTLTEKFPVLTYGPVPTVEREKMSLAIFGKVERALELTWAEIQDLPQSNISADFHCVTRWSKLDVQWAGVLIPDLLKLAKPSESAKAVLIHCYGGYTTNLLLEDFNRPQNILATSLFGEEIPTDHGGPMRLIVPHLYAWKSAKWISGLQFLDTEELGFWEVNGYHRRGDPFKEERFS